MDETTTIYTYAISPWSMALHYGTALGIFAAACAIAVSAIVRRGFRESWPALTTAVVAPPLAAVAIYAVLMTADGAMSRLGLASLVEMAAWLTILSLPATLIGALLGAAARRFHTA